MIPIRRPWSARDRAAAALIAAFLHLAVLAPLADGHSVIVGPIFQPEAEAILDGALPYRDRDFEYPPLAVPVLLAPALASDQPEGYGEAFAWEMIGFDLAIVALLAFWPRASSARIAGALVVYSLGVFALSGALLADSVLDASLPLAHSVLGAVYLTKKQHEPAIAAAERALALDPNFAYGHVALADVLTFAGRPQEAIGLIEKAMRLDPAHPADAFVALGHAYYAAGRYEEAIAALKSALARNPNLFVAHFFLSLSHSELGQEEDARAAVRDPLRLQPIWALEGWKLKMPYQDPAIVARQLDLLQRAGLKWQAPTDNPEALGAFWAGLEAESRGTPEGHAQARQQYTRATALDPQYAAAYAQLGRTYFQEWDRGSNDPQVLERALELIHQAIALDASVPWFHRVLCAVYLRQKQYAPALAAAERAVALGPNEANGYVMLASVLNHTGQPEKAIGLVKKAMRLNPEYSGWYDLTLGWSYALLDRYEEAMAALQSLLKRDPAHLFAHLQLAAIYSASGRETEARAAAADVLRIDPEFTLERVRQHLPFQDPAAIERYLAILRQAGLK